MQFEIVSWRFEVQVSVLRAQAALEPPGQISPP